jgi:hypothetical protein
MPSDIGGTNGIVVSQVIVNGFSFSFNSELLGLLVILFDE